ncbi:macrophage mannose receptor 1-like [Lingula anatina]|uniref:Macrophage mannose receptor 1-like n=1 Tax=Lingula anatina TaxID=7574 RepID=A0A2R2ML48_LINAN|nr:macrophage mannose receptor 1-like [Lingula anatina]|eukprot:XP_023930930.1 macrophage mannose receptor 1-like [Lingula anatina]
MELPVSSGNQSSVPEYWSEGKRPKLLPDQANDSCVVVDPTYGSARASWAATSCSTERAYMCKKTEGDCATGWRSHNGTCYQFNINIKLSWYNASTYCKSQGADMVAVNSNDVQLFLRSRLKELGLDENERLWLGGSDVDDTPKILKWPSGGAVDNNATYWSSSKPRNSSQPLCLEMLSGGEWSTSDQCLKEQSFICQINDGKVVYPPTVKPAKGSCDPGWEAYGFFCYYFDNSASVTWLEAQNICQDLGAEMVQIMNVREMSFINDHLTVSTWLGLSDRSAESEWESTNQKLAKYSNWIPTTPASGGGGAAQGYKCAIVLAGKNKGFWDEVPCNQNNAYMCQKLIGGNSNKCGQSWQDDPLSEFCYQINTNSLSWSEAQLQCKHNGGEMASITSLQEQQHIAARIRAIPDTKYFWIGGNALWRDYGWVWNDGASMAFLNWEAGRPHYAKNADCMEMDALSGVWRDENCHNRRGYICKKRGSTQNTTPSTALSSTTEKPGYPHCDKSWSLYGQGCYRVSEDPGQWTAAKSTCRREGGDIVSILSANENDFVTSLAAEKGENPAGYWTGLNALRISNQFEWADDTSVSFTNWGAREPNVHLGDQLCAGKWSSTDCFLSLPYICKRPAARVTSPPSVMYKGCNKGVTAAYKGSCFTVSSSRVTWSDADVMCRNSGGHLVEINNRLEQAYIAANVGEHWLGIDYWIGLSKDENGTYIWSTGYKLEFTNWDRRHTGMASQHPPLSALPPGPPPAPRGISGRSLREQLYGNQRLTWFEAQDLCTNIGGKLATIHSEEQMKAVMGPHTRFLAKYWIGLYKPDNNGGYVWIDQSALDFTNWEDGEPNDHNGLEGCTTRLRHHENPWFWIGLNELDLESYKWSDGTTVDFLSWEENEPDDNYGGQKCVGFITETGHWHDENCGIENRFICKKHKDSQTTVTPSPTPVIQGNCPPGYHGIGNKCYILYGDATDNTQLLNWTEALDTCASLNSTIASITNPLEQALITTLLKGKSVDFWIGFHKRFITGQNVQKIEWVDNSKVDFDYWSRGEPNGGTYGVAMEDCVNVISRGFSAGRWQDRRCDIKMGFVCQTWKDARYPTPPPSQSPSPCPLGYESFGDACYQVTAAMTWEEANATCRRQQDHLVSVTEPYEQAFVLLKRQRHTSGPIWLGLTRRGSLYYWVDGWPVSYVHWGSTEPSRGETDRCVALMPDGNWNDTDCGLKLQGICKRTSVIPPTTAVNPPGRCPDDKHWFDHGYYCYMFSNRTSYSYGWAHSSFLCQKHGGALASITNQDEMDFILRTIQQERYEKRNLWIGLVRKIKGAFAWFDHTPFNYENWAVGEPDNGNYKECTSVHPANGKWEVTNCYAARGFICKVAKVPPPTTPRPSCRPGWHTKDGMCYKGYYKSLTHKKTWSEARSFCLSRGGDLASFHSAEDVRWFTGTIGFHSRCALKKSKLE